MLNIENRLTLAREEVALKNFVSAIEYIDEILEEYPSNKDALWQRIYIPFLHYIDIICRDFKIEKEIVVNENYEIDYDLTLNARKILELRTESLFYIKTYFEITSDRERDDLFVKLEKNRMVRLYISDLNYLLELDLIANGSCASICKLLVEYCNKIYLEDLKRRFEIPENILNLKAYAEENLKRVNSGMFLEINEDFTSTKIWMEKFLAEDEEHKRKQKALQEKGKTKRERKFKINPVYVFTGFIILLIVMFIILYKILMKYT